MCMMNRVTFAFIGALMAVGGGIGVGAAVAEGDSICLAVAITIAGIGAVVLIVSTVSKMASVIGEVSAKLKSVDMLVEALGNSNVGYEGLAGTEKYNYETVTKWLEKLRKEGEARSLRIDWISTALAEMEKPKKAKKK